MDAVVLAGGVDRGEIVEQTGVAHRPLLEVGGCPIIQRVLAALRGAVTIGRIALVAPEPVHAVVPEAAVDTRVIAGESFVENVEGGVSATDPNAGAVMIVTGDLPLLTPAAVNDFAEQFDSVRVEVAYPIIPRESCERAFPGGRRTYVKLRDGAFTGGNAVILTLDFARRRSDLIRQLYAARKNPLRLAAIFGPGFVVRLLLGRLTLAQLEGRAAEIVDGRVAALVTAHPELGFDVDKLADLEVARRAAALGRI